MNLYSHLKELDEIAPGISIKIDMQNDLLRVTEEWHDGRSYVGHTLCIPRDGFEQCDEWLLMALEKAKVRVARHLSRASELELLANRFKPQR